MSDIFFLYMSDEGYFTFCATSIYAVWHIVLYCVFILSAISPYTTGLKALLNPSDCTGAAPNHK